MVDFSVVTSHADADKPEVSEVIFTTHQQNLDDATPLQLISAARLADLLQIEKAAHQLAAALPPSPTIPNEPTNPG